MGLKTYTLRLDEEVYEGLKKTFAEYGDPDLNISFVIRRYLRDLHDAIPSLKKSPMNILNLLTFYGSMLKQGGRTAEIENLLKGTPIVQRAQAEADDKKKYYRELKRKK